MSEMDKYEAAVAHISSEYCGTPECKICQGHAAYLREHFVTREEYEALSKTVRLHVAEARLWSTKAREWKAELATLTAERDRLRAALKPFAERETVAETLGKETPLPWSGKSPAERLVMMKEAKERHDGEIIAARQALNPEDV